MTLDSDCKICRKEVIRKNKWLSCQKCHDWYHVECLGKKYEKAYFIFEEENVWWVCDECLVKVSDEWRKEEEEDRAPKEVSKEAEVEVSTVTDHDHDYGGAKPRVHRHRRKQGKAGAEEAQDEEKDTGEENTLGEQTEEEGERGATSPEESPEHHKGDKAPEEGLETQSGDKTPVECPEPQKNKKDPKERTEPQRGDKAPAGSTQPQTEKKTPKERAEPWRGDKAPARNPEPQRGDTTPERSQQPRRRNTWVSVGRGAWDRLQRGHADSLPHSKPASSNNGKRKKIWIFGDSLMRGVGRELHFLTNGKWKIEDWSEGGADIRRVEEIMARVFEKDKIEENDYVLIEGGGNALTWLGESETIRTMERMVKMAKDKVKENVIVMNIPMRRGMEKGSFGRMRRSVNRKCLEKLEEWKCDGIQLCETVDWDQVWGRDGVHFRLRAKQWLAMVIEEWLRIRGEEHTEKRESEEAGTR